VRVYALARLPSFPSPPSRDPQTQTVSREGREGCEGRAPANGHHSTESVNLPLFVILNRGVRGEGSHVPSPRSGLRTPGVGPEKPQKLNGELPACVLVYADRSPSFPFTSFARPQTQAGFHAKAAKGAKGEQKSGTPNAPLDGVKPGSGRSLRTPDPGVSFFRRSRSGRLGVFADFDALRRLGTPRLGRRPARGTSTRRNTDRLFSAAHAAVPRALLFAHPATDRLSARRFRAQVGDRGQKSEVGEHCATGV
jgi:hypothetical protein